ncbi:MAG: hypothetical protein JSS49_23490 [Planctomycetes bacterium]|nr:hypothetical protein [Planctomycetota bacterium]
MVYTEPGVAINTGGGATSINSFLGYHNYARFKSGGVTRSFAYAVMIGPDGNTMLSYSGSTPKATSIHGLIAPTAMNAVTQVWQELGFDWR